MATLTLNQLSLLELAKRTSPGGNLQVIAETLSQVNELMQDIPWVEANDKTRHVGTRRTTLPQGTLRQYNQGVAKAVSATKEVAANMAMLESYSIVDVKLAGLSGRPDEFRTGEDVAFVEGMTQQVTGKLFYANTASGGSKDIQGFAAMYNSLAQSNVQSGGVAAGTGGTTSLWIIDWDPVSGAHGIYPQGSASAITQKDLGVRPAYDADNNPYEAYWTHFSWDFGVFVHDDRQVQRICNINAAPGAVSDKFDEDLLIRALNRMRIPGGGPNTRIYANRELKTQMDINAKNKPNVWHTVEDPWGRPVTMFRGIPVRLVDQILSTETAI
jgi:hypothetical protein